MAALTLAVERLAAATVLSCHGALVAASAMQLETALSQALLRPENINIKKVKHNKKRNK